MSKNKFYPEDDINDLIESEEEAFFKGGPGSGRRGGINNQSKPKRSGSEKDIPQNIRSEMSRKLDEVYRKNKLRATNQISIANRDKFKKSYNEDINDLIEEELTKGRGPDRKKRKRRSDAGSGEGNFVYPKVSKKEMIDYVLDIHEQAHGRNGDYDSDVMEAKLEKLSESGLRSFYENTKDRVEN